jgi:hypothetical protein
MALEDAVTLGEALRVCNKDWARRSTLYQRSRVTRTARIVLSGREMGRIYHAKGVERLVRNRPVEGPHARSASTTPWNGCTAGTSTTASSRADPAPPAPQQPPETPHA